MSNNSPNILTLQEKVDLVKNDILTRFPGCSYTVNILLWDDGTDSVQCRHGDNNDNIHYSQYYKNELTFNSIKQDGRVLIIDEMGIEQYMYLVNKKPNEQQ